MATDWRLDGHPLPGEDPLDGSTRVDPDAVREAIQHRRLALATDHGLEHADELLRAEVLAVYGPTVWATYTDQRSRGVRRSPRARARGNARFAAALDGADAVTPST